MASRQRLFLAPVDRNANFIVARYFRLSGKEFKPSRRDGEPPVMFDKDSVNDRKLRQLYVARKIIMVPVEGMPKRRTHLAAHRAAASKAEAALAAIFADKDKKARERQSALSSDPLQAAGYRGPQVPIMDPPPKAAPVQQPVVQVGEPQIEQGQLDQPEQPEPAEQAEPEPAPVYEAKDFLTEVEVRPDSRERQRGRRGR